MGHVDEPAVLLHAEEAFRSAGLWSLAVGLGVAAVGAVALSLLAARRIGSTVDRLADAAERRIPVGLARDGGWGDTTLDLPGGTWHDLLTGTRTDGRLADLLAVHPVALLVKES